MSRELRTKVIKNLWGWVYGWRPDSWFGCLNKNGLRRLIFLNTWSPDGSAIWEGYKSFKSGPNWRKTVIEGSWWSFRAGPHFLFSLCFLLTSHCMLSLAFLPHMTLSSLDLHAKINPFSPKLLPNRAFNQSNRKNNGYRNWCLEWVQYCGQPDYVDVRFLFCEANIKAFGNLDW